MTFQSNAPGSAVTARPDAPNSIKKLEMRVREIDALRGIAAICVMIFHYSVVFPRFFPDAPSVPWKFEAGSYGVFLFFVISGFVICLTLQRTEKISDFAVKRIARLYPVYWAAIAITTAVTTISAIGQLQTSPFHTVANLTMLQSFFMIPSVDGVYWTLEIELAFYFCMSAIWYVIKVKNIEFPVLIWLILSHLLQTTDFIPYRIQLILLTEHIPFFAIGILAYRVWVEQRTWAEQLPYLAIANISLFIQGGVELGIAGAVASIVIWAAVTNRLQFLNNPVLRYFGSISYALYLIHHHAGFVLLLKATDAGLRPLTALITVCLIMFCMAALLHHMIEIPADRAVRKWWSRRLRLST
jgi:peptidoglycan/LPS O-acetylase OafA/YrhL